MSRITNDGLTRSGTGCFIAVATVGVKGLVTAWSHGHTDCFLLNVDRWQALYLIRWCWRRAFFHLQTQQLLRHHRHTHDSHTSAMLDLKLYLSRFRWPIWNAYLIQAAQVWTLLSVSRSSDVFVDLVAYPQGFLSLFLRCLSLVLSTFVCGAFQALHLPPSPTQQLFSV